MVPEQLQGSSQGLWDAASSPLGVSDVPVPVPTDLSESNSRMTCSFFLVILWAYTLSLHPLNADSFDHEA